MNFKANRYAFLVIAAASVAAAYFYHQSEKSADRLDAIAVGNGRIEATEYDIATKYAGRLETVDVNEGDMVTAHQLLATMNTTTLNAQLLEAQANLQQAKDAKEYAEAMVSVRNSELQYAQREFSRSRKLSASGHISQEQLDQSNTNYQTAKSAQLAARIQVRQSDSGIKAAEANIARLKTELTETRLVAPVAGRILYRLAEPGEVLGAGGKALTLLDLTDVYMTIFVPTEHAGKIRIGAEARIILDAIPEYVIPANVSFVAPRTQFTPKAVETRTEREKLMFRVKVKIDPSLLKKHINTVKTGVPGEAYIRLDEQAWPEWLEVKLPE